MVFVWVVNVCVLGGVVWAGVQLARARKRRRQNGRRELVISSLSGLAMGAMLLGLQAIVQPEARHAIVEEQKEESVDDENGEPLGGRLLYEQLLRVRRGEEVEVLTLMMQSSDPPEKSGDQAETSSAG
jgi:hypothetical protein